MCPVALCPCQMLKNAIWLFGVAIFAFLVFLPSYAKMQDLKKINQEYKQQVADLQNENAQLREERRLLNEDPDYLEKVAREKMGLIKEGEVIYKIVPAQEAPTEEKK